MIVLGIDPGSKTGFAVYDNGEIKTLFWLSNKSDISPGLWASVGLVVVEDSRLSKRVWSGGDASGRVMAKIGRDIGAIDAQCARIVEHCEKLGIPCLSVSPKGKGGKLNAQRFKALTGWTAPTNQHERDAAMVAWPHRNKRGAA